LSFFVLRLPLIHIINPTLVGMKRGLFMSYMDTHAAFAPAGGIQELSFDELFMVDGGKVTLRGFGDAVGRGVVFGGIAGGVAGAIFGPGALGGAGAGAVAGGVYNGLDYLWVNWN
jgi:hypothetical protein